LKSEKILRYPKLDFSNYWWNYFLTGNLDDYRGFSPGEKAFCSRKGCGLKKLLPLKPKAPL